VASLKSTSSESLSTSAVATAKTERTSVPTGHPVIPSSVVEPFVLQHITMPTINDPNVGEHVWVEASGATVDVVLL